MLEKFFKRKPKAKTGTYGKSLVLLSSDPAEIERLCDTLGDSYQVVMEIFEMDNGDYGKVILRKEAQNPARTE